MSILNRMSESQNKNQFSGSLLVKKNNKVLVEAHYGLAHRSEQIKNNALTRYGIASGCKLFTAIAICQLVEQGKLGLDTKLTDCLNVFFPYFDEAITVHHLLTHTSGIPDYFDEEVMDDFEELWLKHPMYSLRSLEDFLPLFKDRPMTLKVGERFRYNNAGYILLGLIIEQASQQPFCDYIEENIFQKAGMVSSGYFEFDSLPKNTALGYIDLPDGTWKTNIYSLPAKGGSDGGAYVTVDDMTRFWDALVNDHLLSKEYTHKLLTPYIRTKDDESSFYGYGLWIEKYKEAIFKFHLMGYDPGVSFHSAFYPNYDVKAVVCSNKSSGAYDMMMEIEKELAMLF
nr:serine hydrolase [Pullulanibacillus pueri]